jgi:hypothetical protein
MYIQKKKKELLLVAAKQRVVTRLGVCEGQLFVRVCEA